MKRLAVLAAAFALVSFAAANPRIGRGALAKLELRLDMFLEKGDNPCELLGNTRGVYLDGYGAVFSSLVALVPTPTPSPFRAFTPKDIDSIYEKKVRQVPIMREKMRDMLLLMAADPALEAVRPHEQVVTSVTFFYYKQWENTGGLPLGFTMEAEKGKLLDIGAGRLPRTELDRIVKVEEL